MDAVTRLADQLQKTVVGSAAYVRAVSKPHSILDMSSGD